jgi:hypothetical protein
LLRRTRLDSPEQGVVGKVGVLLGRLVTGVAKHFAHCEEIEAADI